MNLDKYQISSEVYRLIEVKKDDRKFEVKAQDVVSDIDLSHVVINTRTEELNYLINCPSETCQVRKLSGEMYVEKKSFLENWPKDLGKLILWKPSLFIQAKSKTSHLSKPGDQFLIVKLIQEYALVIQLTPPFQEGYLKLSDGISKLDLAEFVLIDKKWRAVNYKTGEGLYLKGQGKKPVSFSKVSGILTAPKTLVATKEIPDESLVPRSHLTFLNQRTEVWNKGYHPDHGFIWWKATLSNQKMYSLDEIRARKIYSLANPKDQEVPILISADGIFFSKNGVEFIKLDQFGNQNWPVAIDPQGYLYVGYQRAHPNHLDFHPFLKPADLAQIFPGYPSGVKILDYSFDKKSIRLLIGGGAKRRWIEGAYLNPLSYPWTPF
jgi:hypothetical protein